MFGSGFTTSVVNNKKTQSGSGSTVDLLKETFKQRHLLAMPDGHLNDRNLIHLQMLGI